MTELFQKFLLLSLFCAGAGAAALLLCRFLRGLSERAKSNFLFTAILLPIGGALLSPLAGLLPKPPRVPSEAAALPPVIREITAFPPADPTPAIPTIPPANPTPAISPAVNPLAAVDWWEVASVLWAAVAVFLLLRMIFSHVRLMRSLGRCRKQVQIEKRLAVYEVSADISPLLTGIFRGSVYLPENRYSEEERAMALAHEQFHFARGDAFKRIVISVLRCVNWLNPPLRIILNRLSDQLEYACDEAVTKTMDREQKKRYGFMLLKTAGFSVGRAGLSVGLSRPSRALKRRIGIFMQEKKKHGTAAKALAAAVLSAAAVSVVGISAAAFLPETENTPAAKDVPAVTGERSEADEAASENSERIPEDRLAEWDFGKLIAETTSPEWDVNAEPKNRFLDGLGDEELKKAYQKAYALFMISYRNCDDLINRALLTEYYGENFYSDAPKVEMADGRDMHPSGYLYEGYENAFFDTFTSDRANAFLVRFSDIAGRSGKELVYEEASNTRHCSPEYEVLSRTENEIVIRETCYGTDAEGNRLDTILYINDNRFVKEDGTWKCADFETKQSAVFAPGMESSSAEEEVSAITGEQNKSNEESILLLDDGKVKIFSGSIQQAFDLPGLYSEDNVPIQPLSEETLFALYRPFGLTRRESDSALIYQGKLVRWFVDGAVPGEGGFATRYAYYNQNGGIDLHTVWEKKDNRGSYDPFGTLTAIEEFDPSSSLGGNEASSADVITEEAKSEAPPKTPVITLRKDINISDILAEQACDPLDPDSMERGFTPGRENYCLFYELPYVTEIYSVADGTVVFSEYTIHSGLTVVVESEDGTCWGYGHCNADYPMASLGDTVKAGDVIGYIGTTGFAADNSLALFLADNISRN